MDGILIFEQKCRVERRRSEGQGEMMVMNGWMGREVQSVLLALTVFNAPSSHSCTTDGRSALSSPAI